jgi:hypothetical protein
LTLTGRQVRTVSYRHRFGAPEAHTFELGIGHGRCCGQTRFFRLEHLVCQTQWLTSSIAPDSPPRAAARGGPGGTTASAVPAPARATAVAAYANRTGLLVDIAFPSVAHHRCT